MVCHPVGILAASLMVVHEFAAPQRRANGVNEVLVSLGCLLAAFLPWFLYIAQSPHIFRPQMAAQPLRKSLYVGSVIGFRGYIDWLMFPFVSATWPEGHCLAGFWPFAFGSGVIVPLLMFCVGLAAILTEGRRRKRCTSGAQRPPLTSSPNEVRQLDSGPTWDSFLRGGRGAGDWNWYTTTERSHRAILWSRVTTRFTASLIHIWTRKQCCKAIRV